MRTLRVLLSMVLFLGVGAVVSTDVGAQQGNWITVEKAMVDRTGGITVEGRHSLAAVYDQLRTEEGLWAYQGSQSVPVQLLADADDVVLIHSNPDNFVVRQAAGRRAMITAEHESSRMQPAFTNAPPGFEPFGDWVPDCDATSCRWVTDRGDYFGSAPYFVYSDAGKFKAGTVVVEVEDLGWWIQIWDSDGTEKIDGAMSSYNSFMQQTLRAVTYRR